MIKNMKLRYISDIHLEYMTIKQVNRFIEGFYSNSDEICILAGDIGTPLTDKYDKFMKHINKSFKKTYVVAGNHEYYNTNKTIRETNKIMMEYFSQYDNITFLNNNYEYYENYCFIGSTLWSNITNPKFQIYDVINIKNFDYVECNILNNESKSFIENSIVDEMCIIITHHIPSRSLIHPKYNTLKWEPYLQCFYSDMDFLIQKKKNNIKCWVYGHTHTPYYKTIFDIPFLCNPVGYYNKNSSHLLNTIFQL